MTLDLIRDNLRYAIVVDDNLEQAKIYAGRLKSIGMNVKYCLTSPETVLDLPWQEKQNIGFMLIDIELGENVMNGIDLAKELWKQEELRKLPVLFYSGLMTSYIAQLDGLYTHRYGAVTKDSFPRIDLTAKLTDIIDGISYFSSDVQVLLRQYRLAESRSPLNLFKKERKPLLSVFIGTANGKSIAQLAEELSVEARTIQNYLRQVYVDLGLDSSKDDTKLETETRKCRLSMMYWVDQMLIWDDKKGIPMTLDDIPFADYQEEINHAYRAARRKGLEE